MDNPVSQLSSLAHPTRLSVFRWLVRAGHEGKRAGEIARHLSVPPSTLSRHLAMLEHAGLIESERRQRNILYRVNGRQVASLMSYLVEDCCGGRPELCGFVTRENVSDAG